MNYRISTEESKRIDILKTLSIIFVVYIHAYAVEVTFAGEHNMLGMPRWLATFEYLISHVISSFAVPMLLLGVTLVLFPGKIPFQESISWSLIGACAVKLDLRLEKLDKIPLRECVSVYLIFTGVTLCTTLPILDRINLFVGVLFWLRMSGFVYHSPKIYAVLTTLTPWVFVIYAFHEPAMSALKKLCFKILPVTSLYLFIEYLLIPIIMIVGCAIFGYILKKLMPKFYGIATGER